MLANDATSLTEIALGKLCSGNPDDKGLLRAGMVGCLGIAIEGCPAFAMIALRLTLPSVCEAFRFGMLRICAERCDGKTKIRDISPSPPYAKKFVYPASVRLMQLLCGVALVMYVEWF